MKNLQIAVDDHSIKNPSITTKRNLKRKQHCGTRSDKKKKKKDMFL